MHHQWCNGALQWREMLSCGARSVGEHLVLPDVMSEFINVLYGWHGTCLKW